MIYDHALMINCDKYDKKCIQESNFLHYKQKNPFIYNFTVYICKLNYVAVCNISSFPEDGYNR
jgi:hypothetical protein